MPYKYMTPLLLFAALWGQSAALSPFSTFDVYIYPEYSHPGVGVVVEGEVLPGQFPRLMQMEVPLETTIALVRVGDEDEGQRIEVNERDGRAYISVDITGPKFQVQYFYNPFEEDKGPRSFEFIFSADEQFDEVHFIVQQPLHAENFTHTLPDAERVDGDFGLVFFREHKQGLAPGERHTFSVSYNNPDGILSITTLEAMAAVQQLAAGADRHDPTNMKALMLVSALFGVGIFGAMKIMKRAGYAPVIATSPQESAPAAAKAVKALFCSKCGAPRRDHGQFCHQCGREF
ncbi:MAG: zinc ribbon domain-containing protein [Candidatus Marinimicrobia bacterium]|nr:zinc ribbon domain-containing protein [Candidatus Neomarinimicrobiota bacterium]